MRAAAGYTVSTDTVRAGTSVAQTVVEIITPTTTIITAVLSGIRVARNRRTGDTQIVGSKASQKATADPAPKTGARVKGAQTGGNKATPTLAVENLTHTRDKRYSSRGNGYHSQEKKQWHPDRVKGRERPDSGEDSLFVFDWR